MDRSRALELKLELALAERGSGGSADGHHRPNGNHRPSDGRDGPDGRLQDRWIDGDGDGDSRFDGRV